MKSIIYSLFAMFLAASAMHGCSSDDSDKPAQADEVSALVDASLQEMNGIEVDISRGFLLRNLNEPMRDEIEQLLYELKLGLLRIKKDRTQLEGLGPMIRAFNDLRSRSFTDIDDAKITSLLAKIADLLQGLKLDVIVDLVVQDFSRGLGQFRQFSSNPGIAWKSEARAGRTYAVVSGFGQGAGETWLFTPVLDLTNASNVTVSFEEAFGFTPQDGDVDILISKNFNGGDPRDASWESFDTGERGSFDVFFQWRKTGRLSLDSFQGEKVVIGFRYRCEDRRAATWEIDEFRIEGNWNFQAYPVGEKAGDQSDGDNGGVNLPVGGENELFTEGFTGGLGSFVSFSDNGAVDWYYNDKSKSAYVNAFGKGAATAWLFSPSLNLADASEAQLSFRQTYNFGPQEGDVDVLITTNFNAADPNQSDWQKIDYKTRPEFENSQWTSSELIDLNTYLGKNIVIGFRYRAEANRSAAWLVDGVTITGVGTISQEALSIEAQTPEPPTEPEGPADAENEAFELFDAGTGPVSFSFEQGDANFLSWTVSGPASWRPIDVQKKAFFMKASGYFNGKSYASETWLLSPLVKVPADGSLYDLSIRHALGPNLNGLVEDDYKIWIAALDTVPTSFDELTDQWQALAIQNFPTQKWAVVEAGPFSLADFAGKQVVIGIQYKSTDDRSLTWEIESVSVSKKVVGE